MSIGTGRGLTEISGRVEDIIYINPENGFTVIEFRAGSEEDTIRASGILPDLFPGEFITLTGSMEDHRVYGETFKVLKCTKAIPGDRDSLVVFLSCGLFNGVGEVTARAIVDRFGEATIETILYAPERLSVVRNVTKKKALAIGETFREYFNFSETLKFFADMDISTRVAMSVYKKFGVNSVAVTKRNPYCLIEEVPNLGFKTADRIAMGLGVDQNSGSRVCAFIRYYLQSQLGFGNVCFPREMLLDSVAFELNTDRAGVEEALSSLLLSGALVEYKPDRSVDGETYVFISYIDMCEQYVADRLKEISEAAAPIKKKAKIDFDGFIENFSSESGFELDEVQIAAVKAAVDNGFSVITGGPGTGKTTIIKAVYQYLSLSGLKCMLAAPTGRAAKRMAEAVGIAAATIHRLLEYSAYSRDELMDDLTGEEEGLRFNRDESNPLDADVLIIDESSMLDTLLAYHMLKALKPGARLVLLGDKDQLPSVGPGNVLKDVIASNLFPVARLSYVYRQSDESLIAYNAQRINSGELPEMNRRGKDFFMVDCPDPALVPETLTDIVTRRLPGAYGIDPMKDIQVLIPGKKGECGVDNVNKMLQEALNPGDGAANQWTGRGRETRSLPFGENVFRVRDRVMQIKNNYDIEWVSTSNRGVTGKGIFNGEMGSITQIDMSTRTMTVLFDGERAAEYPFELLNQLELCYAITVHKSQGSEFDYCVMPLSGIPSRLCTRNILYTAVTRAKKMVVLVGDRQYIKMMTDNNTEEKRYTCLTGRLRGDAAPEDLPIWQEG